MLIQIENDSPKGNPITEENFRRAFNNISFPSILTPDAVEPLGYGLYEFSVKPETSDKHKKVIEVSPQKTENRAWRQSWKIVSMNEDEKAQADAEQAKVIRLNRSSRLLSSDWTQLSDAPVDATTWATYRQALRDITSQSGFPWDVQWPDQPQ